MSTPITFYNTSSNMKDSEKQAILANVKKVEEEELAKIAAKLAEWKTANKKETKSTADSTNSKTTKKASRSEDKDSKRKTDESSSKAEKSTKKAKAESTKVEKKEVHMSPSPFLLMHSFLSLPNSRHRHSTVL